MYYLFNNSADPTETPKDIWLTTKGTPVFATQLSKDFSAIPQGSKLAGKIEAANPEPYQLSNADQLTEAGKTYCGIMGVEQSSESLAKFLGTSGFKKVDVNSVVKRDFH